MAKIMVIDDEADVLLLVEAILTRAGHEVSTCSSGLETLKKLGLQPDDASAELPDLLVLDIMMPKMDGYSVITMVRDNPRTRAIPILVISALDKIPRSSSSPVLMDGYLTKPFTHKDLFGNVEKLLKGRKAQA
ncbi:MAG: response regulator [Elusimicrobia bacterium]|nr:response regulator [Elusimicrobiota bacterium]